MTSEPVGNGPRMSNIPNNSHKQREEKPPSAAAPKEKAQKIVEGKVVVKKTPFFKRVARSMVADDASSVGEFMVTDVVVPAMKNLLFEMVTQGARRTLWGASMRGAGPARSGIISAATGSVLKTNYHDVPTGRPSMPSPTRNSHDFSTLVVESREDAESIIVALMDDIARYQQATVEDFYGYLGVTSDWADGKWGWKDLSTADIRQTQGGWRFDLPPTVQLR